MGCPVGVGLLGRRDAPALPPRGEISFCLFSQASFSRNTSIWQRMVRGLCLGGVYACLLHGCVYFFTSSSTQLVHRAVRLESEVFPWHLENSSSFQWSGVPNEKGIGELSGKPRPGLCRGLSRGLCAQELRVWTQICEWGIKGSWTHFLGLL